MRESNKSEIKRTTSNKSRFESLFIEMFISHYNIYRYQQNNSSSNDAINTAAKIVNTISSVKRSSKGIIGEKASTGLGIISGVISGIKSKKVNSTSRYLSELSKNDKIKISTISCKFYNRFQFAIEKLENSKDGLDKFVEFFIAVIFKKMASPTLNLQELVDKTIDFTLFVPQKDPLFCDKKTKKKLKLKCIDGEKKWTIEGLIHRSPAQIMDVENELWVRDGKKNDRSDKYPKQCLLTKEEAECNGFIKLIGSEETDNNSINGVPSPVPSNPHTKRNLIVGSISITTIVAMGVGVFALKQNSSHNASIITVNFTI